MHLSAYTEETREDIADVERLRDLFDELMTVLSDIERRLETLENAQNP